MPVKKKAVKPSQVQMEERVQYAEVLLRKGPILKHRLMKRLKEKFNVEHRTAEEYLARARARLILHVSKLKEEHRADSIAWWEGNLINAKCSQTLKQAARKQMDDLLGLRQPTQIEHSGAIASPVGVDITKLNLDIETRKRLLAAIRKKYGADTDK